MRLFFFSKLKCQNYSGTLDSESLLPDSPRKLGMEGLHSMEAGFRMWWVEPAFI